MLQLTFNPGLTLTGFRTTWPRTQYEETFTQLNEHCDCLILGHVPLIKFKCNLTGIQLGSCCPHAVFPSTSSREKSGLSGKQN